MCCNSILPLVISQIPQTSGGVRTEATYRGIGSMAMHVNVIYSMFCFIWLVFGLCSWVQTGFTAMHTAAKAGQIEFLRQMISKIDATLVTQPPKTDTTMQWTINAEVKSDQHSCLEFVCSSHKSLWWVLLTISMISVIAVINYSNVSWACGVHNPISPCDWCDNLRISNGYDRREFTIS